jgi:hypothetical protein
VIQRLRQKFGEAIRSEIAETVETEEEIAGELRYLIEVLQARRVCRWSGIRRSRPHFFGP